MAKTEDLGRDTEKSLETMDKLIDCLKDFSKAPIKKGLQSNHAYDDKVQKIVNEAKEKAFTLSSVIEDLKDSIKSIRKDRNSRFAKIVVSKYLQEST